MEEFNYEDYLNCQKWVKQKVASRKAEGHVLYQLEKTKENHLYDELSKILLNEILLRKLNKKEEVVVNELLRQENEKQRNIGKREGRVERTLETARKMLELDISIENIKKVTGLTKKQIEKL